MFLSGDFNHVSLAKTLPTFKQYVDCTTREDKTLDLFYANVKNAYNCSALPPLGRSDHCLVHLSPTYTPAVINNLSGKGDTCDFGHWCVLKHSHVFVGHSCGSTELSADPTLLSFAWSWTLKAEQPSARLLQGLEHALRNPFWNWVWNRTSRGDGDGVWPGLLCPPGRSALGSAAFLRGSLSSRRGHTATWRRPGCGWFPPPRATVLRRLVPAPAGPVGLTGRDAISRRRSAGLGEHLARCVGGERRSSGETQSQRFTLPLFLLPVFKHDAVRWAKQALRLHRHIEELGFFPQRETGQVQPPCSLLRDHQSHGPSGHLDSAPVKAQAQVRHNAQLIPQGWGGWRWHVDLQLCLVGQQQRRCVERPHRRGHRLVVLPGHWRLEGVGSGRQCRTRQSHGGLLHGVEERCQQWFNWRQVGEPFFLHTGPIQPWATLDRDLGWERLAPRPGRFIQALGKGRKQQAGQGFRLWESLALVVRCGGLHRGLRLLDVQPRSCPFAGLVEVHADGRVRGAGARAAYHHRRCGAGGKGSSSSSEPRLIDSSPDSE